MCSAGSIDTTGLSGGSVPLTAWRRSSPAIAGSASDSRIPISSLRSRKNRVRSRPAGLVNATTMVWRQSMTSSARIQPSAGPLIGRPTSTHSTPASVRRSKA